MSLHPIIDRVLSIRMDGPANGLLLERPET